MLSIIHMGELEARVYNTLHQELSGIIPTAYYARSYPGGRFIIIMEDLEERGIKPYWMGDMCSLNHARAGAVALAKIHSKFWNSDRFEHDLCWIRPRSRRFGELWMRKLSQDSRKRFLATDMGKNLPVYMHNLIRQWDENCTTVYNYWETKPQTLLHGDPHLGNSLEYKDGTAGYYDWQCLFRGYGYRDLSYFLMTAMTNADCKAHEKEIFKLYTATLEQNGVNVDHGEAWLDYTLFALDALDAVLTSLANSSGFGHAQSGFERALETMSAAIQNHDVLALLQKVIETGST
jgi:hypothetical protein